MRPAFFDPTSDIGQLQRRSVDISNLPDLSAEHLEIVPIERSETIPSSWYTHSGFHALDRSYVFGQSWQYAGHENRIPDPGDYLTEIIAGNPVIVIRSKEGDVSAFYNVCRHRGGPLAMESCGSATMLQCKYHGWTYKLDGTLRGVPRFDRTDLFDKKAFGLIPIAVQSWQGLLFVHLNEEILTPLDNLLTGIPERIVPMRLDSKKYHGRTSYEVGCNWKVYVDNYLEGYHIPLVHPDLCDLLDYRAYETETAPFYSLQHSPFKGDEDRYGNEEGDAFYYFVFPNLMLNILPGRLQTNRVSAVSPDRCRVDFDYYYDHLDSDTSKRWIEQDYRFSDQVQAEDIEICEFVHRGLASEAYDRGRFSVDAELGVHHFQELLKTAYARSVVDGTGKEPEKLAKRDSAPF